MLDYYPNYTLNVLLYLFVLNNLFAQLYQVFLSNTNNLHTVVWL